MTGRKFGEEVSLGLQQLPTHLAIASADSEAMKDSTMKEKQAEKFAKN